MNLVEHYTKLYNDAIQKIKSDNYQTDQLIDSSSDKRLGLTLIIRPDNSVCTKIQSFLNELKSIEPNQYYYPDSDIHITVLSIISCYQGFDLARIAIPDYIDRIAMSLPVQKEIEIKFKGITLSPSCIMIQGFMSDNTLNEIRDQLRINFKSSVLEQTIDTRYSIQTAHSTVVRFRTALTQKNEYLKVLEDYRNHCFGTFKTHTLELVCNDWYQRKKNVEELYRFKI